VEIKYLGFYLRRLRRWPWIMNWCSRAVFAKFWIFGVPQFFGCVRTLKNFTYVFNIAFIGFRQIVSQLSRIDTSNSSWAFDIIICVSPPGQSRFRLFDSVVWHSQYSDIRGATAPMYCVLCLLFLFNRVALADSIAEIVTVCHGSWSVVGFSWHWLFRVTLLTSLARELQPSLGLLSQAHAKVTTS